jgi:chromosome segregation ATPase
MDTERKVSQLDADVHEIYELLRGLRRDVDALRRSSDEQWGMLKRQSNRLDALEASVAQLKDDVAGLKVDMVEVKGSLAEILELLRPGSGS